MDLSQLLHRQFGFSDFRPAQKQVIDHVMAGENVLAVMPTGSGKSLCYQLPALALPGLTVIVSPLISLMKDQVDHLMKLGLPATMINSTVSRQHQRARLQSALSGEIKMLYVAPERFRNEQFRLGLSKAQICLFAVDEAHCVSLWGHDFRPDYLRLKEFAQQSKTRCILGLTATATPPVRMDIVRQLGIENAAQVVSGFDRPNLFLEVNEVSSTTEKLRFIARIARSAKLGIVYGGTRNNVEGIRSSLKRLGLVAVAYHAGLSAVERRAAQERFMQSEQCVIVATNAFGMGIDRREVRFVIHSDIPVSLEAYYQEIGRAGRDGQPSRCTLLFNYADKWLPEFLIDSNHPAPGILKYTFSNLCKVGTTEVLNAAWRKVSQGKDSRFFSSIAVLQREGYLERVQNSEGQGVRLLRRTDPELTGLNFGELALRRMFEQQKLEVMLTYANRFQRHCYRKFVLQYFGERTANRNCGNCGRCVPEKRISLRE